MWILYVLIGLLGFAVFAILAGGFVAYNMALMRKKKKPVIQNNPDPKAVVRQEKTKIGKEYLFSKNPEDVTLKARDGLVLKGWFLPAQKASDKLVVFAHGYNCNGPDEFAAFIKFYHEELNYHILLPDHRAHGRSPGRFIGFAALEWRDILDWADAYVNRLGPDTQVVLHGVSMGGATVMNCNANNPPDYVKCVVEDCGYTNGYEMISLAGRRDLGIRITPLYWAAALWFRLYTGKSLMKDSDPYGNISKFAKPTLFIHGANDTFVPAEMGLRCYEAATVEKDLWLAEGAGHAQSYYLCQGEYEARLGAWLERWMGERVTV